MDKDNILLQIEAEERKAISAACVRLSSFFSINTAEVERLLIALIGTARVSDATIGSIRGAGEKLASIFPQPVVILDTAAFYRPAAVDVWWRRFDKRRY